MKTEQAKKLSEQALEKLADALGRGESDDLNRYLTTMARFPAYSFRNVLLIVAQRPDATHVAGFHTWRKLGRFVRKGEKGIAVVAPMMIDQKNGQPAEGDDERIMRFRAVHVFDVSQTDGEPLPEFAQVNGDPGMYTALLRTYIAKQGITINMHEELDGANGVSMGGVIAVQTGLPAAEEFSVLVHELAHEMMHKDLTCRPHKIVRETEAEAVAFVVCEAIGLNSLTHAADYIHLYEGDQERLAASLDRIQRTAAAIVDGILVKEVRAAA
jgi:antirestriction protein ArdC